MREEQQSQQSQREHAAHHAQTLATPVPIAQTYYSAAVSVAMKPARREQQTVDADVERDKPRAILCD